LEENDLSKRIKVNQQSMCPMGHIMDPLIGDIESICEYCRCGNTIFVGDLVYSCAMCNFDICQSCGDSAVVPFQTPFQNVPASKLEDTICFSDCSSEYTSDGSGSATGELGKNIESIQCSQGHMLSVGTIFSPLESPHVSYRKCSYCNTVLPHRSCVLECKSCDIQVCRKCIKGPVHPLDDDVDKTLPSDGCRISPVDSRIQVLPSHHLVETTNTFSLVIDERLLCDKCDNVIPLRSAFFTCSEDCNFDICARCYRGGYVGVRYIWDQQYLAFLPSSETHDVNVKLGEFKTEHEAALAHDHALIDKGLLGVLNFPELCAGCDYRATCYIQSRNTWRSILLHESNITYMSQNEFPDELSAARDIDHTCIPKQAEYRKNGLQIAQQVASSFGCHESLAPKLLELFHVPEASLNTAISNLGVEEYLPPIRIESMIDRIIKLGGYDFVNKETEEAVWKQREANTGSEKFTKDERIPRLYYSTRESMRTNKQSVSMITENFVRLDGNLRPLLFKHLTSRNTVRAVAEVTGMKSHDQVFTNGNIEGIHYSDTTDSYVVKIAEPNRSFRTVTSFSSNSPQLAMNVFNGERLRLECKGKESNNPPVAFVNGKSVRVFSDLIQLSDEELAREVMSRKERLERALQASTAPGGNRNSLLGALGLPQVSDSYELLDSLKGVGEAKKPSLSGLKFTVGSALIGLNVLRVFPGLQHGIPAKVHAFDKRDGYQLMYADGETEMVKDINDIAIVKQDDIQNMGDLENLKSVLETTNDAILILVDIFNGTAALSEDVVQIKDAKNAVSLLCSEGCGQVFFDKKEYDLHIETKRCVKSPFKCHLGCNQYFNTEYDLKMHISICMFQNPDTVCPLCGTIFPCSRLVTEMKRTQLISFEKHFESGKCKSLSTLMKASRGTSKKLTRFQNLYCPKNLGTLAEFRAMYDHSVVEMAKEKCFLKTNQISTNTLDCPLCGRNDHFKGPGCPGIDAIRTDVNIPLHVEIAFSIYHELSSEETGAQAFKQALESKLVELREVREELLCAIATIGVSQGLTKRLQETRNLLGVKLNAVSKWLDDFKQNDSRICPTAKLGSIVNKAKLAHGTDNICFSHLGRLQDMRDIHQDSIQEENDEATFMAGTNSSDSSDGHSEM